MIRRPYYRDPYCMYSIRKDARCVLLRMSSNLFHVRFKPLTQHVLLSSKAFRPY